jgi:hypothetical protein
MSKPVSKLKKAFSAAAADVKKNLYDGFIEAGMTATATALFLKLTGASLAGTAAPILAGAAAISYGPSAIKAGYKAYKNG